MKCTHQSPTLELSTRRRVLIFILGFFDNCLFGGAIFGWPQLVYVLKKEGIYADLCDEVIGQEGLVNMTSMPSGKIIMGMDFSNVSRCLESSDVNGSASFMSEQVTQKQCILQDERFAFLYTLAVVFYGMPGVLIGYFLHYSGLRITRFLAGLMVSCSFICLGLTSVENPNWLYATTILLAVGGNQLRMSVMQFGDLFPSRRSTTITVLSGVYAASASLFLLFYIADENGVERQTVSFAIGGFALASALLSVVMPAHHIPFAEEKDHYAPSEVTKKYITEEGDDVPAIPHSNVPPSSPLWNSVKSLSSNLHMYWFFILLFSTNTYQQFYNVWVTASTCTLEEAGLYSTFFSYSNLVCVFCAPVGGMTTDYFIMKAKKANLVNKVDFQTKEIQANFYPLLVTTFAGLAMHSCLFFFNPTAIIVSLCCMIIIRPCVVAISVAYSRIRFPPEHFNRLQGIYCTVSSALMYMQYPVFKWAQEMYYPALGLIAGLILLSFLNPLHLLCTSFVRKSVVRREKYLK